MHTVTHSPRARHRSRRGQLSASAFVAVLLITACGADVEGTPAANGADNGTAGPVDIRLSTGGAQPPNEMQAAIFNGELEEQGVLTGIGEDYNLEMTFASGTPQAQSLLVSGEVDFATLAFSTISTTVQEDAIPEGFSIVAGHFVDGYPERFSNTYLVLSDSGITSVADLEGRTVGVNAVGSAVDVIIRHALVEAGLDPVNDVEYAEIGFGAMGQALREGRIDVGSMVQPFDALEKAEGGVDVLLTAEEAVGENSAIAVVARNDFLAEHPEAARSFLADWVAGLKWMEDPANRDAAMEIISEVAGTDVAVLDVFYGTEQDYFRHPDGCPSAQALQAGVDAMVGIGYLDESVDMAALVDTSYLPTPEACS